MIRCWQLPANPQEDRPAKYELWVILRITFGGQYGPVGMRYHMKRILVAICRPFHKLLERGSGRLIAGKPSGPDHGFHHPDSGIHGGERPPTGLSDGRL